MKMDSESENVLKALSSSTRRTIMKQISEKGSATYTEIMQVLGLDPSLMSGTFNYHLKELNEAGLIERTNGEYRISDLGKRALILVDQVAKDAKIDKYGVLSAVMSMRPTQEFSLFVGQMGIIIGLMLTFLSFILYMQTWGAGTIDSWLVLFAFGTSVVIAVGAIANVVAIVRKFKVGFSILLFLSTDWFFIRSPNRNRFFVLTLAIVITLIAGMLAIVLPVTGTMAPYTLEWYGFFVFAVGFGLLSTWLFFSTMNRARALEEMHDGR